MKARCEGNALAWDGFEEGDMNGIWVRVFDPAGNPLTGALRANVQHQMVQAFPSIAAHDDRFVVAWESEQQDGNKYGVFAARFD